MSVDQGTALTNWTAELVASPVVTLVVGSEPEPAKFYAHEAMLVKAEFFEKALSSTFREAIDKVIEMPADDPEDVEFLIAFLYDGSVDAALQRIRNPINARYALEYGPVNELANLWMFADKMLFPRLQNELMIKMRGIVAEDPDYLGDIVMLNIYRNTTADSILRTFAIDVEWAYNTRDLQPDSLHNYPDASDILKDLLDKALLALKSGSRAREPPGPATSYFV